MTAAGLAALAATDKLFAQADSTTADGHPLIQPGDVILFQGDSITDAGRKRDKASEPNSPDGLGKGYAWLAASQLLVDRPDDGLKIYNRGISGNKVFQLADRWQEDCLDLKPNVLSILIGVNDIWHTMKHDYKGTVEIYETDYRKLLARTKEALPEVRLVVCEPFVLRFGAVEDSWFPEFDEYRAAAKRVADGAGALFVSYQAMFDIAAKIAPPERWLQDGVHPKPDGSALMAHWWLRAVG
jgi:lysophospholipase L1-like esterase